MWPNEWPRWRVVRPCTQESDERRQVALFDNTRLFAYGALSVILVLYLTKLGLSDSQTGMLLTLTLVGDTLVSLFLTTRAYRIGRRRMLIIGALLMAGAGLTFVATSNLLVLSRAEDELAD